MATRVIGARDSGEEFLFLGVGSSHARWFPKLGIGPCGGLLVDDFMDRFAKKPDDFTPLGEAASSVEVFDCVEGRYEDLLLDIRRAYRMGRSIPQYDPHVTPASVEIMLADFLTTHCTAASDATAHRGRVPARPQARDRARKALVTSFVQILKHARAHWPTEDNVPTPALLLDPHRASTLFAFMRTDAALSGNSRYKLCLAAAKYARHELELRRDNDPLARSPALRVIEGELELANSQRQLESRTAQERSQEELVQRRQWYEQEEGRGDCDLVVM
jgi:hypothetical protein